MRKRFATKAKYGKSQYYQKRVDENYFTGYVCHLKMNNVNKPLMVNYNENEICILDNNYEWLELYPDNENYAITIMYDDKKELIEWYFDIAKEIGLENGIPYEDDLYLDVVIMPNGETLIIDEDELQEALDNKTISSEEFDMAYKIAERIKNKYGKSINELTELTNDIYANVKKELKNKREWEREV